MNWKLAACLVWLLVHYEPKHRIIRRPLRRRTDINPDPERDKVYLPHQYRCYAPERKPYELATPPMVIREDCTAAGFMQAPPATRLAWLQQHMELYD